MTGWILFLYNPIKSIKLSVSILLILDAADTQVKTRLGLHTQTHMHKKDLVENQLDHLKYYPQSVLKFHKKWLT